MEIITDPQQFRDKCRLWRAKGVDTVLVPTMGAFHKGHLQLMDHAREHGDKVIVSLFVNPTQFSPTEDLAAYPRNLERDADLAREHGVDVLFTPEAGSMYEEGHATWVEVPDLARDLCALSRPDHFRGVATIVTKLLMLAMPKAAVFGEKDRQQLVIIQRMVRDLNIPVDIIGHPIVREEDGLAMSSRNAYLTPEERAMAPALHKGLLAAVEWVRDGLRDPDELADRLETFYASDLARGEVDYIRTVDPETLEKVKRIEPTTLLAVAFHLGRARLLDNILITV